MNLKAAFFSQAIADAVGNPFEFRNPKPTELKELLKSGETLLITDDTQMALFGQEALLRAEDLPDIKKEVREAYLRWYDTQVVAKTSKYVNDPGLVNEPKMRARRVPGNTCLGSLQDILEGKPVRPDGRGCGAVMRLLPFAGLLDKHSFETVQLIAIESAHITHRHPEVETAVKLYMALANILRTRSKNVIPLNATSITAYGQGFYALECVNMAAWAVKHAQTYEELLYLSICHPGDSDSVAAVAGSLWGIAGLGGFEPYIQRLEEKLVIENLLNQKGKL